MRRKIITFLMFFLMIFALIACTKAGTDGGPVPGTAAPDGENGAGSDGTGKIDDGSAGNEKRILKTAVPETALRTATERRL